MSERNKRKDNNETKLTTKESIAAAPASTTPSSPPLPPTQPLLGNEATPVMDANTAAVILAEIRTVSEDLRTFRREVSGDLQAFRREVNGDIHAFRQEVNGDMHAFRQEVNGRLETLALSMTEVRQSVSGLGSRLDEVEGRVGENEDGCALNQRILGYLLKRERQLEERCELLETASRRNNIRVFNVVEESESGDTVKWGEKFIKELLHLPPDTELRLERMHRSLVKRPGPEAPPRSFVARFLDFQTKQKVLMTAWSMKELKYKDRKIGFDNDYPPAVQRRRKEYAEIKRQLKAKNIPFKSRHPSRLLVELPSGSKMFSSAWEAVEGLADQGIKASLSDWEKLEREQRRIGWMIAGREDAGEAARRRGMLRDAEGLLKRSGS